MPTLPNHEQFPRLLQELSRLPKETEWIEFKHNNDDPQMIGEYISALANSAALLGKQSAYVVWVLQMKIMSCWEQILNLPQHGINSRNWKTGYCRKLLQRFISSFWNLKWKTSLLLFWKSAQPIIRLYNSMV